MGERESGEWGRWVEAHRAGLEGAGRGIHFGGRVQRRIKGRMRFGFGMRTLCMEEDEEEEDTVVGVGVEEEEEEEEVMMMGETQRERRSRRCSVRE